MMFDHIVYLSLGSNLGAREDNILRALSVISSIRQLHLTSFSSLYETRPQDLSTEMLFVNAACSVATSFEPVPLLRALAEIESSLGRNRGKGIEDRTIDIDILMYDELVISTNDLIIPHPRMLERPFVMIPLNEIAPLLKIPPKMVDIRGVVSSLDEDYWVRKISARFMGSIHSGYY